MNRLSRAPRLVAAALFFALALPITASRAEPRDVVEQIVLAGTLSEADRAEIARFYERRDFQPLWITQGRLNERAGALVMALRAANQHGLHTADYWTDSLANATRQSAGDPLIADVALTIAALRYAQDLQGGRAGSIALPADIRLPRRATGSEALLEAIERQAPETLAETLPPRDPISDGLRQALADHRAIAVSGGWPRIAGGAILEPGTEDARVPMLRKRLAATDEAPIEAGENSNLYDPDLIAAVRRFQARHGLPVDGRVGRITLAALNVTVNERIDQIEVNLDRARLFAARRSVPGPHIAINIPEFKLQVVEGETTHLEMKVIVGRPERPTPVLSSRANEVVINPSWTVPHKLARFDMLPRLRADAALVARQGFRVYRGGYETPVEIDPREVDWKRVRPGAFYYWMRQDPGPGNALGQVRISFPNTFDVYMHDTPDKHYFERDMRALSSGCIRLERPMELAEFVLRHNAGWSREAIDLADTQPETQMVGVRRPVPVHLEYRTAWLAGNGTMQFRDDIYGLDKQFRRGYGERTAQIAEAARALF